MNIPNIEETNVRNYLILASLNPDLPTIPMVEGEIVAGSECRRWSGVIGNAKVHEYTFKEMYADGMQYLFKDDTEPLETYLSENGYTDEEIAAEIAGIEWQKAIFLNIDVG